MKPTQELAYPVLIPRVEILVKDVCVVVCVCVFGISDFISQQIFMVIRRKNI